MAKTETTRQLERLLEARLQCGGGPYVFECSYGFGGGNEIVDAIQSNSHGFTCYEIKISVSDYKSKAAKSFFGHKNYFVMPYALYKKVKDDIAVNYPYVGVLVPVSLRKYPGARIGYDESHDTMPCYRDDRFIQNNPNFMFDDFENGELRVVRNATSQFLRADTIVILKSMMRSMERDFQRGSRFPVPKREPLEQTNCLDTDDIKEEK